MAAVGALLSEYRKRNRLSQLDLSLLADVSSRHISFIETGRTRPSRSMLLRLAEVLNLAHKDSNLLLHSGGYAAAYSDLDLASAEMSPVRTALNMILENHMPFPALVMDASYNLLMANSSQHQLMAMVPGIASGGTGLNLMEAVFHPGQFRPLIANWPEVASHLLRRLRRQVLAYNKPAQIELLEKLTAMNPPANWETPDEKAEDGPMLTVDLYLGDLTLSLFTTISQFGTALDSGMEEILIESYFPGDKITRQFFETRVANATQATKMN